MDDDLKIQAFKVLFRPVQMNWGATLVGHFNITIGPVYMNACRLYWSAEGGFHASLPVCKSDGAKVGFTSPALYREMTKKAKEAFFAIGGTVADTEAEPKQIGDLPMLKVSE